MKIFRRQICWNIDVYMDDIIVKTLDQQNHIDGIGEFFQELRYKTCVSIQLSVFLG